MAGSGLYGQPSMARVVAGMKHCVYDFRALGLHATSVRLLRS